MRAVVTGAGGFVGSNLVDALLAAGWDVTGVDAFTDYYDPSLKRSNIAAAMADQRFVLHEIDLRTAEIAPIIDGADVVFHQAAQPGVRNSWSSGFSDYLDQNVAVTQRLLEACRTTTPRRLVVASSSSVYGNAAHYPVTEDDPLRPHSPYGVTKLAAERLCLAYAENFAVPVVSLRYFTVYGPRQRPDMAIQRMIVAALGGPRFGVFGDGEQRRDFTYVGDVVRANVCAAMADVGPGEVFNIGGGSEITVNGLLDVVGAAVGSAVPVDRQPTQPGDVRQTGADVSAAATRLGWRPEYDVTAGVAAQVAWNRSIG